MLTLGIDLASQDRDTASCLVNWGKGVAQVEAPVVGRSNDHLLEATARADWVGIDAPFGWPDAFIEAVWEYAEQGSWPASDLGWAPRVNRLRYRATDLFVEERARQPLSVSSDRIAVTAMRCAALLTALSPDGQPLDRCGAEQVVEVYPAAALAVWCFDLKGYKGTTPEARQVRRDLMSAIGERAAPWLELAAAVVEECIRKDHALDALVSSLVCRACAIGLTWPSEADERPDMPAGVDLTDRQLEREGWIHVPRNAETFDRLAA